MKVHLEVKVKYPLWHINVDGTLVFIFQGPCYGDQYGVYSGILNQ